MKIILEMGLSMIKSHIAGGVVVGPNGKVVVVEQSNDAWSLPKGHIDEGETPLEAAKREIAEESGVTQLKLIRPLLSYQRYKTAIDGGDYEVEWKTITMYLFSTKQKELSAMDPENPQAIWVDPSDVERRLTHRKDKAFFAAVVSQI